MKTYAVVFTPRAERQLAELYAYIADHDGALRAEKFVGEIVADCLSLSSFPARGAKRDDIRPPCASRALPDACRSRFLLASEPMS